MTPLSPVDALTRLDAESMGAPRTGADRRGPTVAVSSPAVPTELIRAAGLVPIVMRGDTRATPEADTHLEPGVFEPRIRRVVNDALTGALAEHAQLVLPRTSDQDYKCFLYLREFQRTTASLRLPPVVLLDVLQSSAPYVRAYACDRLRAWLGDLDAIAGRSTTAADIHAAIAAANTARAAARRLIALRQGTPRVLGADVFPLLAAYWNTAPDVYAALAHAAADLLADGAPIERPRVLLAGAPVETPRLHHAIEGRGAIVVAEISPWGTHVAGSDVSPTGDPFEALFDKYQAETIGPRLPVDEAARVFTRALDDGIDGVVFVLPESDDVHGWDYPRMRRLADDRLVPYLRLEVDEFAPWPAAESDRVAGFVHHARRHEEARARG